MRYVPNGMSTEGAMAEIHDERPDRWLVLEMVVEEASGYHARLADCVAHIAEDLEGSYTAGPIAALQAAIRSGRLGEARNTLLLAAGAGITVALALGRQAPP
jgi:3-oxoacyl-[acyl-carrier-protein] synthase III